jgi:DNA invertase Pin-like site-specific DNA recombinase
MKGSSVGYIRVSSVDQNTERQLADVELNKTWLYMDSKVFLTRVESKEESRALPRFLTL